MDVRPLVEGDLAAAADADFAAHQALALRHGAGSEVAAVRDSRTRLRRLFATDPLGGFGAFVGPDLVGYAWVHPRGPIVTIGALAVEPARQGQGVGRALLDHCVATVGSRAAQIRLVHDGADPAALGLLLRVGFRVVAPLVELGLEPGRSLSPGAGPRTPLRPAAATDAPRIVTRDARAFGTTRPRDVERWLHGAVAMIAERSGSVVGYALQSPGRLGPATADDAEVLLAMLRALMPEAPRRESLRVLVSATDRVLVDGLLRMGFRVVHAPQYLVRGGGTAPPSGYVLSGPSQG